MLSRSLKSAFLAAFVTTSATGAAQADNLGAAIVGGVIGGVIMNEANKNRRTRTRTVVVQPSATRAYHRETQSSLNYFGFNAGTPDGIPGSRTRSAISRYQAFMGWPASGRLSDYQRDFIVSSHNRAQVGGPEVVKAMQSSPQGVRVLLRKWHGDSSGIGNRTTTYNGMPAPVSAAVDEIADSSDPSAEQLLQRSGFVQLADLNGDGKTDYILDTSVTGSQFWCGEQSCSVLVFASSPDGYKRNDFLTHEAKPAVFSCHQGSCRMNENATTQASAEPQARQPQTQTASAETGQQEPVKIQPFALSGRDKPAPSLASHCSKVSLLTNSNGGFVTKATLNDPDFALSEQFCLTRTYARGTGGDMVAKGQGLSAAQVDAQCDAFGPALAPYVTQLGSQSAAQMTAQVQKFALQSDMSLSQLRDTAKICLFSGYRRDDMDVALGSALLLVGTGNKPYAELVGHHLSQGFGATTNSDLAQDWYMIAVDSLESGVGPVFAPGQPERVSLLRAATERLGGASAANVTPEPASSTLPSFSLE